MDDLNILDERREFAERRRSVIGATDTPAILGLSRRGTALSVYQEKIGIAEPGEMSLPAWLGLKLEATVAELYTTATGQKLRADNKQHVMKDYPFIGCHLDFRAWGRPELLVEIKTRAYTTGWGEEGTEDVPADIWAQCQHEMLVTGTTSCDIAVLFGHNAFRIYHIKRHDEFLAKLVPQLAEFWVRVQERNPPEPSGSDLDAAILRREFPDDSEAAKAATPEQNALARQYLMTVANKKQVEQRENELKNKLIKIIGPAAGLRGAFGEITFKKSADSTSITWQLVAAAYRKRILDMERALGTEESVVSAGVQLDAVESLYTETREGTRRFLVKTVQEEA